MRVHVRRLRTKLEPDQEKPRFMKTVFGAGYFLELPTGDKISEIQPLITQVREANSLKNKPEEEVSQEEVIELEDNNKKSIKKK